MSVQFTLIRLCKEFELYLNWNKFTELDDNENLVYLLKLAYKDVSSNLETSQLQIQAVLDKAWGIVNTGIWSDVPFRIRNIYAFASIMKVCCILKSCSEPDNILTVLKSALTAADDGLLLGAGLHKELTNIASSLTTAIFMEENKDGIDFSKISLKYQEKSDDWDICGVKGQIVEQLHAPSLEKFSSGHFFPRLPVKLTGCIDHWPALERWTNLEYLLKICGPRKVPIELGSKYTESDWSMKLTTIREFILEHIVSKQSTVGYLAQHQLFNQISELKEDIRVPDYCCLSDDNDESSVEINAWFGPPHTVSPLHFDIKHNLLSQVVGRKRILLFNPQNSEYVYPYDGKILFNTAQVDPEAPDYSKFGNFKKATCYECHLYPGELLYIPPNWWHHVRALDVSFSVSFWWK